MTKELRRLSIVMLFMFLALFVSTSWIQVVQADALADDPLNRRALYDSYEVQRGSIVASGSAIASSAPSDDVYSWQRVYTDPHLWHNVTGWINPVLGSATGIEQSMNQELSGTGGSQFLTRIDRILTGQPPRGSNVTLTLDAAGQQAAYEGLEGLQGAVVAIEPATGRVLVMMSTPGFDTNVLASHDTGAATDYYDGLLADPAHPLYNRGIGGDLNPPGSTFKIVVASAALASGQWTADSTLPNPSSYQLPDSTSVVRNATGGSCGWGDSVSIATALRLSCNIPFAQLAVQLGSQAILEQAEKFGFNTSFETPLVSTPSSYPVTALDGAQTALTGFGQGQVTATPLQMAMVSAGIANGGIVMNPRMVDQVTGADLSVQHTFDNTEYRRALEGPIAAELNRMMVDGVSDGVASGARIDGVDVAGKTGTAENGDDQPYTLWFTGFAPAEDPRIAVAVVVEDGGGQGQSGSGDEIAAPIAKRVMEAVLGR